uniref:Calcineurin-like phosphoesterase domain-containing protein n=1 Tax=Pyramimonas obovata TaxID=1411642 RepID=A0A7S0WLK8_9CHLO|mmetsp:Transcript_29821/g.65168  ORF Transcript_29821/g.65168 Transcript_29821/m.65168 type:complete len:407 (+) Transcript_29821:97-1317(+)|eukprot:CAMPEP_0118927942 /NCGR_PEP_ID=MMETSP1169-20130426/5311_1 /TAXON_ID=36882 /ORGANISM="Pyramimonas obovata, Strain CCMP722" /LENGTH=406 /DNA_ID=CAMNT_0006869817 /DNA_START=73 /DNA_END=1293 /DNA_ORIENTATION=-
MRADVLLAGTVLFGTVTKGLTISRSKSMKRTKVPISHGSGAVASQSGNVATPFVEPVEKTEHDRQPLFRFGLISDTQYVDAEDGSNFPKTKIRRYRHSLQVLRRAVADWNKQHQCGRPMDFVIQLGDAIDGKCAQLTTSSSAVEDLVLEKEACLCQKWHWCIGNHELYNFSTTEWVKRLFLPEYQRSYYDFSPREGWRVVMMDSYEISLMAPEGSEERAEAVRVLQENNPNDVINGTTWFKGVEGLQRRFVPYNGQFSDTQLQWLRQVLEGASTRGERVLIACHQPCYPQCTNDCNLPFNYDKCLRILHSFPGVVVAWLAGHDHDGGYAMDDCGIHHMVPASPLEVEVGEDAYGHVEVLPEEGLRVVWTGRMPRKGQWPEVLPYPTSDRPSVTVSDALAPLASEAP